ncbi:MAG: zf-HC2 domain-containing protein [Planctomycetes bacterium]|nr:zf-HC2 domain-containing protein [Planctomycetota bacterium]
MRGWLRDAADGDLGPAETRAVEEHVHVCRACSIELSRAEHEVLRLRQAFRELGAGEPKLPAGLGRRIVQRLVLDETSILPAATMAAARAEAEVRLAAEARLRGGAEGRRPEWLARGGWMRRGWRGRGGAFLRSPLTQLVFMLVLLLGLGVGFAVLDEDGALPDRVSRLVVLDADDAFHGGSRLSRGQNLGENQVLQVRRGGGALVEWSDATEFAQPAARLRLSGEGNVQLHNGVPQLVNGRVEVLTKRPVSLAMGDGSEIVLGIGQYVIEADLRVDGDFDLVRPPDSGLSSRPDDLRVTVEVLQGDTAKVERVSGPAFVQAGQIGLYQGSGALVVRQGGGFVATADNFEELRQPVNEEPLAEARLSGHVYESTGSPGVGTTVAMALSVGGQALSLGQVTGPDGSFSLATGASADSPFAIVLAAPASVRRDLGVITPEARVLTRQALDAQVSLPLVLENSVPVIGIVHDDLGQTVQGVQVLPCVVDELFGHVLCLTTERAFTDELGRFRIERLPSRLPPGQALVLLLLHAELETTVVAVPERGDEMAAVVLAPMVARHLQQVALHQLPPNTSIEILEEVPGLPPECAAWRRRAMTNGQGRVELLSVGYGAMWLRLIGPGQAMVRRLVLDDLSGVPRYAPVVGPWKPLTSVFSQLQAIPDSSSDANVRIEVASSFRYQHFLTGASPGSGRALHALDGFGVGVVAAEVFAVDPAGPRGAAQVRFLGFTSNSGALSIASRTSTEGLAIVGHDGGTAFVTPEALNASAAATVSVTVQRPGRVLVHQSLRPSPMAPYRLVAVEFRREDASLPGIAPVFRRFASDVHAWEITDVPPGEYGAYINGVKHAIVVPPDGFVILQ